MFVETILLFVPLNVRNSAAVEQLYMCECVLFYFIIYSF